MICHNFYYENLPSSWAYAKLSDVAFITMGQSPSGSDISSEKKNNSAEFHQGKLAFGNEIIKHSNRYAINFKKIAEANSILFCVRAPVGELNLTNRVVAIGRGLCSIKPFENILDLRFLYFVLMYLKPFIIDKGGGSTFDEITVDIIKKIIIPIPPLREQILIAEKIKGAFELSKAITKNKEHIANITAILKSKILDSIFGENSSYKSYYKNEYSLGDLLKYEQPGPFIVKSTDYRDVYKTPVLTPGKSFILGYTNEKDGIYKLNGKKVIIFDDFTTASRLIDFDFKIKSSAMKILSNTNESKFDTDYLYYLLQTIYVNNDTHKRYWISEYVPIKVKVHTLDNQIKIVEDIKRAYDILESINAI